LPVKLPRSASRAKLFFCGMRCWTGLPQLSPRRNYEAMTLRFCLILALALLPALARADLTIVQKVEGGVPFSEMTMKIKGDRARVEAGPDISTIVNGRTGEAVNIKHSQKMIMRISAEQSKAAAEMAAKSMGESAAAPAGKLKLTPSGKKEKINDYDTEEYIYETPLFKASYWVAKDYPRSAEIMQQMQALSSQALSSSPMGMPDFRDLPGLPLRTNVNMGGQSMVTTVTSVNHDPIDEAEFSVPVGYQEMKAPDINELMKAQEGATKPTASPAKK